MVLYLDEYTPNDSRTHEKTSWFIYDSEIVDNTIDPIYTILESTENKLYMKLPVGLMTHKLWVKVRRHMSDGTFIQPKVFIVDGPPQRITPQMEAPVRIPSITLVSEELDTDGDIVLKGSPIEPVHNILAEAFWSIVVDGKPVATKKVEGYDVTFTTAELSTTDAPEPVKESRNIYATLIYKSLEGVVSHAAYLDIRSYIDTDTKLLRANAIDPMDTFDIRLSNGADVITVILINTHGEVIFQTTDDKIPSALMEYSKYYRIVVNYKLNDIFGTVDSSAKTIDDELAFEIDYDYEYTETIDYKKYPNIEGKYFYIDEAPGGFRLEPTNDMCIIADTNKGDKPVFSTPHSRYKSINVDNGYTIRNIGNHTFLIHNDASVTTYDAVNDIRSMHLMAEEMIDTISDVVGHRGYIYYITPHKHIMRKPVSGGTSEYMADIPEHLDPKSGKYGISAHGGYLYISGPLDALLRFEILTKDFDYLQRLPEDKLNRIVILKNHDMMLLSFDLTTAWIYHYKDDNFTQFEIIGNMRGVVRNQDGSIIMIYDDGISKLYR